MTTGVVLAVLFGALLHAGWNALLKGGRDLLMDTALVAAGASVAVAPLLPWVDFPGPNQWPFIVGSMAVHVGYYAAIVWTYRHGDLSLGYPIMRGSAPLFVALAGIPLLGDAPTARGWLGIGLVCAGVVTLALARRGVPKPGGNLPAAVAFALLNALLIASYTLIDTAGVREPGSLAGYLAWMFFVEGMPFVAIVAALRGRRFAAHLRSHWRRGLVGGAASGASYGIALWATTVAAVGPVIALRETSVVFAALIGRRFFGEPVTRAHWLGIALVVAGVCAIRLAAR